MEIQMNRNKEKGFTLVEVLISLAILSVGLLAAATMQTTAIKGNMTSNEMGMGTLAGQYALEQLLVRDASTDPTLTAGVHAWAASSVNGITYNPSYTVLTNTPIPGVRTIVMQVNWTDTNAHSVTLVGRTTP